MSIYSTQDITRERAIELLEEIRIEELKDKTLNGLSNDELEKKLNQYTYSENYRDILGLNNFNIAN